jgi:hypothetical protein
MRTKSFLFVLILLSCTATAFAQREETLLGRRSWGFSGIWGGYNHQYTQFDGADSYNRGGFFGFEFGKSLLLGWGRYRLDDPFDWQNTDRRFNMRWNVAKVGYAFIPYKAVHPMFNVDFGTGRVDLGSERDRVFVVQPSAGIEINVFRWFRLGLEGGYRFTNDVDIVGLTDTRLSGAYGQASLKFGFSWGRYHKRNTGRSERAKNYDE